MWRFSYPLSASIVSRCWRLRLRVCVCAWAAIIACARLHPVVHGFTSRGCCRGLLRADAGDGGDLRLRSEFFPPPCVIARVFVVSRDIRG